MTDTYKFSPAVVIPIHCTHVNMGAGMVKVWTTTNDENLFRHEGGTQYGRFHPGGKRKLFGMESNVFSAAKPRPRDEAAKAGRLPGIGTRRGDGRSDNGRVHGLVISLQI